MMWLAWRSAVATAFFMLLGQEMARAEAPTCAGLLVDAAPAPVAAGHAAVYVRPNYDATGFTISWLDPGGNEVNFELSPARDYAHYLRPSIDIREGTHTLIYSDNCVSSEFELVFQTAKPPSQPLGEVQASYEPYCPGSVDSKGVALDYPPPVHVAFVLNGELEPYRNFMHVILADDTGTSGLESWGDPSIRTHASWATGCANLSSSVPPGMRTFTASGEIVDGPNLGSVSKSINIVCATCEESTGGADASMGKDASAEGVSLPTRSNSTRARPTGCTVAAVTNDAQDAAPAGWLTLILVFVGARLRHLV